MALPAPEPMCFLIADISGYTAYLSAVELDHANDILADLIGTVVESLQPGFELSKVEGDAAFTFSLTEAVDGSNLLDTIERCYFDFRKRRRNVKQATTCECNACRRIPDLDLKVVVHFGEAIVQTIAGRSELVGLDAIVVHRMLKNSVVSSLGMAAYALISQQAIGVSGLDPEELGMTHHIEAYDQIGDVPAWAHDLRRRWDEEQERERVRVDPSRAVLDLSLLTEAPPQVAWEFLTRPGQRMSWQPWVTEVAVKGARGGRRGVGSANHCMHGKDKVIEEILDWRPYDYVTDLTILATPIGPVSLLHTIEFEPADAGTNIHFRFAAPESEPEQEAMKEIGPAYGQALEETFPELAAQLATAAGS